MSLDVLHMHETQMVVLNAIQGLVRDWHKVETVAGFAGLDIETTSDALCELQLCKEIEISEWEDGIWVRLIKKVKPLTDKQKTMLEEYYHLVVEFADLYAKDADPDDFLGSLTLKLISMLDMLSKVKKREPDRRLEGLIWTNFRLHRKTWYRENRKLRGIRSNDDLRPKINSIDDELIIDPRFGRDHPFFEKLDNIDEISHLTSKTMNKAELQTFLLYYGYNFTNEQIGKMLGRSKDKIRDFTATFLNHIQIKLGLKEGDPNNRRHIRDKGEKKYFFSDKGKKRFYVWDKDKDESFSAASATFIGSTIPWVRKAEKHEVCLICKGRELKENEYCLYCDKWGLMPDYKPVENKYTKKGVTDKTLSHQTKEERKVKNKTKPKNLKMAS